MAFLTIFTAPKPFTDPHIALIQENAIRSWKNLGRDVEVILIGNEKGLKKTAQEMDVQLEPFVLRNDFGTPLVNSIFDQARTNSSADYLLYANADIIFLPSFLSTVKSLVRQTKEFLAVGRRWDLDIKSILEFTPEGCETLRQQVLNNGKRKSSQAIDYFLFPKNLFEETPPFAIGRAGWDNWMLYHAVEKDWLLVDMSPTVMAIHQNHDYSHLPGGKIHYNLQESHHNVSLGGGIQNMYNLLDTNRELRNGELRKPRWSLLRLLRRMERTLTTADQSGWRWFAARRFKRARAKLESFHR